MVTGKINATYRADLACPSRTARASDGVSMQENEARPHLFLRGYARIPISNLRFDTGREEDGNITSRLIKIFKSPRGCQNEDPANLISIVLEDDIDLQLSKAIHDAPLLDTRHVQAFTCLHGRHRVLAARKVLPARDRWWIAKVYDRGQYDHAPRQLMIPD